MIARLRRAGRWRDGGALAALLALAIQLGVFAAHIPPSLAAAAWLTGPLCHAGNAGDPAKPAAPIKAPSCPICLSLAAGAAGPLPAVPAPLLLRMADDVAALPSAAAPERATAPLAAAQPRAPPRVA